MACVGRGTDGGKTHVARRSSSSFSSFFLSQIHVEEEAKLRSMIHCPFELEGGRYLWLTFIFHLIQIIVMTPQMGTRLTRPYLLVQAYTKVYDMYTRVVKTARGRHHERISRPVRPVST